MRAKLVNLSPLPRSHWAVVTFPARRVEDFKVEATFLTDRGQRFRAVRGSTVGFKTVYRIQAALGGHEAIEGELVNETHKNASPFFPHPWTLDDVTALLPAFGVQHEGGARSWSDPPDLVRLLGASPAHQRWHVKTRIPGSGLIGEFWLDLLSTDPVIPFWGKIVWSDRRDPRPLVRYPAVAISTGEFLKLDFSTRHGILTPYRDANNKWVTILNSAPLSFQDGAGLPLSGALLAIRQPKAGDPIVDPESSADWVGFSLRNLQAALGGPIVGACEGWDGWWLAHRFTPMGARSFAPEAVAAWERFQAMLSSPAGWFAERPLGVTSTPGQTGDQEDFGASKGTFVVTERDPRHIFSLLYSVQAELFRGFNHYESTGLPLKAEDHPSWVTWSGVTHYHPGVSPDRLGKKDDWGVVPGTGWYGMDDQHRSQNNLAAYLLLSDDPLIEDQLRHILTTDEASYRLRFPQYGPGAPRAQGRVVGAWSHALTVTEGETQARLYRLLLARLDITINNPLLSVPGPMKVLGTGGPDERVPIVDEAHNLAPYVSIWEHALAVIGLYGAVKQDVRADLLPVLQTVCRTLAEFAFFKEGGAWWTVDNVLWKGGEPVPGGLKVGSPHIVAWKGAPGTCSWTVAGLLVAREVLGAGYSQELDSYLEAMTSAGAQDVRTAEWWASVDWKQIPLF